MDLFIIDGIGPFFRGCDQAVVNWSKAPFPTLERGDGLAAGRCAEMKADFFAFCSRAAAAGYNAITLDDLAHCCIFPFYSDGLQRRMVDYRRLYHALFATAAHFGMKVLITTDLLFFNEEIENHVAPKDAALRRFAVHACRQLFEEFPEVGGLVVRIGEADGRDVVGDFRSRIVIKTPQQARRMIEALLPEFETFDRLLIFRTWSAGIGRVGDLIWNPETYDQVFRELDSAHLIVSMKHGPSDFFRFLALNRLFFRGKQRKLVEFQARREYEGFGEYPSFTGWDDEKIRDQLVGQNLAGISVCCQTGGWSGFRRLTWLDDNAVWSEINAFVTVRLFRDNLTADQAIQLYHRENKPDPHWRPLQQLLRLSDEVVKELLYIEDFASRQLYFRRLRVPPLVTVYWRYVVVNHFMRKFMRCYVRNGRGAVEQGRRALEKIERMKALAQHLGLPAEDFDFQYATFEILSAVREYYFLDYSKEVTERIERLKAAYEQKYAGPRYSVMLDFSRFRLRRAHLQLMLRILFRGEHRYRFFDRLVALNILSAVYPSLKRFSHRAVPDFSPESALGFDASFQ